MGEPTYGGRALVLGAGPGLGLKARVKAQTIGGGIPMYEEASFRDFSQPGSG